MSIKPKLEFWESMLKDNDRQNICPKCQTKVDKSELRLKGRNWHQHCFQCSNCRKILNLATYREVNNDLFCPECYGKCFLNGWRCSEIINTRRLSKLMSNVVMDGQKYRWRNSTALANESDTLDSDVTSFHSALSHMSGQASADSDENSCPANDSGTACVSVNEPSPLRTRACTSVEKPVSMRFGIARNPNAARFATQMSRRFASEGIPQRCFEPNVSDSETSPLPAPRPDGEQRSAAPQLRLCHPWGGVSEPKPDEVEDVDDDDNDEEDEASRRAYVEPLISRIPLIKELSEDSDTENDSRNSQPESSASQESLPSPLPPRKPQRHIHCDGKSNIAAATAAAAERTEEKQVAKVVGTTPSEAVTSRLANPSFIRHTRFPSDHITHRPLPPRRE